MTPDRGVIGGAQEEFHGSEHDYVVGSPHLRHAHLRHMIDSRISRAITEIYAERGGCAVLEIGAGHGGFTDVCVSAGASVCVTEMSRPSCDRLEKRFAGERAVTVVFDEDGSTASGLGREFDLILMISVVHHIPDYMSVISTLVDGSLRPGGTFMTFQDPMWYPSQGPLATAISRGAYYAWRVTQGDVKRIVSTGLRRVRGRLDEGNPADLVEYHVVRNGVDQNALVDALTPRFTSTELVEYFSTQGPLMQRLGDVTGVPPNTFGLACRGRRQTAQTKRDR